MKGLRWLLVVAVCMGWTLPVHAASLTVAAASSAQEPLTELIQRFERETGQAVRPVFGASGKFVAQITQGAPFDLFFSADDVYPRRLAEASLAGTPRRYARGRLVLWSPIGSPLDVRKGLDVLRAPGLKRLAIANPKLAPYGRAAVEAMRAAQVAEAVQPKLVLGENVAQTLQFVTSGGADLGLIPLSMALSSKLQGRGTYWLLPATLHAPLDAEAVLLNATKNRPLAERFLDYCTSSRSASVWRRYGLAE
ncbi:MAG TPA: molybdate ABC transporter substrate-binding protein [Stenomitos sp.]